MCCRHITNARSPGKAESACSVLEKDVTLWAGAGLVGVAQVAQAKMCTLIRDLTRIQSVSVFLGKVIAIYYLNYVTSLKSQTTYQHHLSDLFPRFSEARMVGEKYSEVNVCTMVMEPCLGTIKQA